MDPEFARIVQQENTLQIMAARPVLIVDFISTLMLQVFQAVLNALERLTL
jgi:flagellar biosynthesis protein FliQ